MAFWEVMLIALALSMDALAVSVCKGCAADRADAKHACAVGLYFGGFQTLMPFLGYMLGARFSSLIENVDHWIGFILLLIIGAKMVLDARGKASEEMDGGVGFREMLPLAVATSIDALAVGITFAALGVSPLAPPLVIIGATTFALSFTGYIVGRKIGAVFQKNAATVGGTVLMFLGLKILAEHMGWIG